MKKLFWLFIVLGFLILISVVINSYQVTVIPLIPPKTSNPSVITTAKVVSVIDGDTIVIDTGQHIRYIGMNTPELETSECFATEAAVINKNLVLGKVVRLEKDVSETDKYGRLLRYVFLDNNFINDELVKDGAAKIETVPPDTKYKQEFLDSEKRAQQMHLGLWSRCESLQ